VGLLVLLVLLQGTSLTGEWVGPLELTVQQPRKVRGPVPTVVDITQAGDKVTGAWRTLEPNTFSGTFAGTLAGGELKITAVVYTDADLPDGAIAPERCQAEVDFSGTVTGSGMLRLTAKRMFPDKRPRRDCGEWPTDLVWTLQRH